MPKRVVPRHPDEVKKDLANIAPGADASALTGLAKKPQVPAREIAAAVRDFCDDNELNSMQMHAKVTQAMLDPSQDEAYRNGL
jgi:hypothetical protein